MTVKTEIHAGSDEYDTTPEIEGEAKPEEAGKKEESLADFALFVVKLVVLVLLLRSFVFSPFSIPSESMLPRLWNGDYLLASKWSYGYSKYSLPGEVPLIPGRILASEPEAGDVAIFKHPLDGTDYIKRVIGLPGDSIGMINGQIVLNGELVKKERIEDFVQPVDQIMLDAQQADRDLGYFAPSPCAGLQFEELSENGVRQCRYPQFLETLPSGVSYRVLDMTNEVVDDFSPVIVPEGHMFVMGDNRDNSQDSRVEAQVGGGVGIVPQENLVAKAQFIIWSTDGSSSWILPWTWFTAARWSRLGAGL